MHKRNKKEFERSFDLLLKDIDSYPVHFILHLVHAFEVVGFYHNETDTKNLFNKLYKKACSTFHMKPENKIEFDERLADKI